MCSRIIFAIVLTLLLSNTRLMAQGWRAEISVYVFHDGVALSSLASIEVSFSGQVNNVYNVGNYYYMSIEGVGNPSGFLSVFTSGYLDDGSPVLTCGAAGPGFNTPCLAMPFAGTNGLTSLEGSVTFYPRVTLSNPNYTQACTSNFSMLTATGCDVEEWRISTISGGPYQPITGEVGATLALTRAMVANLGFSNSTTTFYVVAKSHGRTISEQRQITIYYPQSQITATPVDPACHAGTGTISITITPSNPAIVNFIVSLATNNLADAPEIQQTNLNSNTHSFLGLSTGNYFVRVRNNTQTDAYGNCLAISDQKIITVPPPVNVSLTPTNITCNGYSNGSIQVSTQNATAPLAYSWTGGGSGNNPRTNLGVANYSVTVTDNKGCTGSNNVSISQPDPLTVDATSPNSYGTYQVKCQANSDGVINTSVVGGTGSKNYAWSSGQTSANLQNVGVGAYHVTVTDANGCQASDDIQLQAPPVIDFSILVDDIDCPGTATGSLMPQNIINTSGTLMYSWLSGETTSTINTKSAGQYSLTITDGNGTGCSATKQQTLVDPLPYTVQVAPFSNFHGSYISCDGALDGVLTATLTNPAGAVVVAQNYEWYRNGNSYTGGGTLSTLTDLNAGTYRVDAQYGAGCIAQSTFVLNDPSPVAPIISAASNYNGFRISCPGESDGILLATGSGGTPGGYSFQWVDGPANESYPNLVAGTYFVHATDINGCVGEASYQLNDPPPLNASINITSNYHGQHLSCTGASDASLAGQSYGGAAPYTFLWSNGATGISASNLAAGSYSLVVSDANGCETAAPEIELVDPLPINAAIETTSDYNGQAILCFNSSSGALQASATGGTSQYNYQWNTGGTTNSITSLPAGLYSVIATDQNNCQGTSEISLLNPEPVLASVINHSDFNGYGIQCHGGDNGFIEVVAVGGTNSFTYAWSGLPETTSRVEHLSAGIFNGTVSDSNGCTENFSFGLTQPTPLVLAVADFINLTCFESNDGTVTLEADGGYGNYSYSLDGTEWQDGSSFSSLPAGPHTPIVRDQNQCAATTEQSLTQPERIAMDFVVQPALCANPVGAVSASVTGGNGSFFYEWKNSKGEIVGFYSSFDKSYAGIFTLRVRDVGNCSMEESIAIPSSDGATLSIAENQNAKCFESADGFARLEVVAGKGPFNIIWEDGETTWFNTALSRGAHYASVTDVNNCLTTLQVITGTPKPIEVTFLDVKNPSCFSSCDGSAKAYVTGGNNQYFYNWNGAVGSGQVSNLCAGLYTANIVDQLGCTGSAQLRLEQPDKLELKVISKKLPLCHGKCDGIIEVSATGGNGNFAYAWEAGSSLQLQDNLCAGSHHVLVTDNLQCSASLDVALSQPLPLREILIKNQPPTCHDGANGMLEVIASGGAGNYSFAWNNGVRTAQNTDLAPGHYQLKITDSNNCELDQEFLVPNVPILIIDLGGVITICEGQTHTLNAGTSWKKTEWRNSTGWIASSPSITISAPGQYQIECTDVNNCLATDSFVLQTSDNLLQAAIIVAADAMIGDTVVVIDVTWPLPDEIMWTLPGEMIKLSDNGDRIDGKFEEAGEYEIVLNASLGQCHDQVSKTITILERDEVANSGRLGASDFVKNFTLHPNPTTGSFDVEVEFAEESPLTITIWNLVNLLMVSKVTDDGKSHYEQHFDLDNVSAGAYLIRIDHKGGHSTIRFLIK